MSTGTRRLPLAASTALFAGLVLLLVLPPAVSWAAPLDQQDATTTPTTTPSPTPTPASTTTPTASPTLTPTPTPTPALTATPTVTPTATAAATDTPTPLPTDTPVPTPEACPNASQSSHGPGVLAVLGAAAAAPAAAACPTATSVVPAHLRLTDGRTWPADTRLGPDWLDGEWGVIVDRPGTTGETITDIDRIEGNVLIEDKSADDAINRVTLADDRDQFIERLRKKLDSYIDARQYIPYYEHAALRLVFGTSFIPANPEFRAMVLEAVQRYRDEHSDVTIYFDDSDWVIRAQADGTQTIDGQRGAYACGICSTS